jgi:two-component system, LuxR family, sensor kinase FixL
MTMLFDKRNTAAAEINTDAGSRQRDENALPRLTTIVESPNDAIIGKTLDGIVSDWNTAAEAMFAYSATEIVGRPVVVLSPPECITEEAAILERIRHGEKVETFETTRRRKDGRVIPVAVTISPTLDLSGTIVGASTIVRDLSEGVDCDGRLKELQLELVHVSCLSGIGQLVAALVHEINQPLTAINVYVGGLRRLLASNDSERMSFALQKIAEQNDRACAIMHRLHDVARKGAPTTTGEDVTSTIVEAIELALIATGAKGVAIGTRIARDATRVEIDRIQIRQVLFNLIRNGMEAMEGCLHRTLTVAARAEGESMVEISIADTGQGLPDEVRSNLFGPFAATKPNGMGIGLSICHSIVEEHGGRLWVESNPEGGTVFRFTLRRESPDRLGQNDRSPGGTNAQSAPENDSACSK